MTLNQDFFWCTDHEQFFFLTISTRGVLLCLLGFWPLGQNPAGAINKRGEFIFGGELINIESYCELVKFKTTQLLVYEFRFCPSYQLRFVKKSLYYQPVLDKEFH